MRHFYLGQTRHYYLGPTHLQNIMYLMLTDYIHNGCPARVWKPEVFVMIQRSVETG